MFDLAGKINLAVLRNATPLYSISTIFLVTWILAHFFFLFSNCILQSLEFIASNELSASGAAHTSDGVSWFPDVKEGVKDEEEKFVSHSTVSSWIF
jgi:hypothetical protein